MSEKATGGSGRDPREARGFGELLARYVEQFNATGFVDPEEVLEAHPELGPTILEDLETYVELCAGGEGSESWDESPEPLGSLGDYRLRRQIGRGGMGVVYEAWENSMNRPVALKVLPAAVAADPKALTRFVREAQVAGGLHHPNIVPVYGIGVKEKTPFFAMEYGVQFEGFCKPL